LENLEDKKTKIIKSNTSIVDNNIIESPLFISSAKEIMTIGQLEKSDISPSVERVLKVLKEDFQKAPIPADYENFPVVYKSWKDSKGMKRELLITCSIPDMTTMDVWNGLIGLYIQKITPIYFNKENSTYDISEDEMEYTLYELAKFMNKSTGGKSLDNLMKEIIRLNNATYYSFANGVIFDKKNDKYLKSKTKGFSLIVDCEFDSEKRVKDQKVNTKCKVQFNRLIVDNIRYQYIKYINPKEYFALPPRGFTRRLYIYLKGNSYLSNGHKSIYIKRSFDVLRNKLPIYEYQPSKIKERLKKPLEYLKKFNIISDYFFGDEVILNGVAERCVYFIFEGTKEDLIKNLSYKKLKISSDEKELKFKMEVPEDLHNFLVHKGFNEIVAKEILYKYDKWDVIKYILWLQEKEFENNKSVKNFPGMLRFALESGTVNLKNTHKHIIDFVESKKLSEKSNKFNREEDLKKMYKEYIEEETEKFKNEDEVAFKVLHDTILENLNSSYESKIKEFALFEKDVTELEKASWEYQKGKWIEFNEIKEKSRLFKEQFEKSLVMLRNLKFYEDFKLTEINR
jgi:hypothetical protein